MRKDLTDHECDVLWGVISGDSPMEIVDNLDLADRRVVDETMRNIRRKYGAATSAHAVTIGIRRGDITCRALQIREPLSDDELELLADIAEGHTARALAKKYFCVPQAIEKRINKKILPKLGATSWEHAVYLGFCCRLLPYGGQKRQGLSAEDARILVAYVESKTNGEAAKKLKVSLSTYNKHAKRVWGKLDADNMVHAVMRAMERRELHYIHMRYSRKMPVNILELKVYRCTAQGMTQREVAIATRLSERKVNELLASAQQKLGARHLAHGVVLLFQCGAFK